MGNWCILDKDKNKNWNYDGIVYKKKPTHKEVNNKVWIIFIYKINNYTNRNHLNNNIWKKLMKCKYEKPNDEEL